ncbi:hypothetical protein [Spiroplasma endosymbiont of Sarcophaga variegata]
MTTNYKTSFLIPHDYEIPTFNYPEYVLPPVPYNYQEYTKDIIPSDVVQPLKTKITTPEQCKHSNIPNSYFNLFSDEFNSAYYEVEIDLKQIDPTIQSISKFQDAYKTIEISNLSNLQVECGPCDIENFIPNRNVNILAGYSTCEYNFGTLSDASLQESGSSQTDKVNFPNIFRINDTKEITNNIKTFTTGKTNGLPSYDDYKSRYTISWRRWPINFLTCIL